MWANPQRMRLWGPETWNSFNYDALRVEAGVLPRIENIQRYYVLNKMYNIFVVDIYSKCYQIITLELLLLQKCN